jgi:hypothetical protein
MKLSLTTTISMASIVAAGAAAYAINVNVLEAPAAANPVAISATPTGTAVATPSGEASTQSMRSPLEVQEVSVTADTTKYQVGTAGAVLLSGTGSALTVASITPAAGWTSEPSRTLPDGSVSIHFTSGTQRLEFVARKVSGKIVTSVVEDTPPVAAPVPAPGVAPAPIVGAPSGSLPAVGAKPQIPSAIGGDDDDDRDHEDEDDEDHDDDDEEDDD